MPSPSGWRCEVCDLQENLWMNLTDGKVFCGRRYFDGTGGNNHALLHFQQTGFPLAVKLGTITPDGAGRSLEEYKKSVLMRPCCESQGRMVWTCPYSDER
jgi:hypothetical protein